MTILARKHSYLDGAVLDSSDWNDEFNMILQALGYFANDDGFDYPLTINGFDDLNPILLVNGLLGNPFELERADESVFNYFRITKDGKITNDALYGPGDVSIEVNSTVLCPNLNAASLNLADSSTLQTALYAFDSYSVFYPDNDASLAPDTSTFICGENGGIITKLKAKQEGVASANASTIITVYKNNVSIGTISIAGNDTTVQSNNITDVPLVEDDKIDFVVTTYSGTTKHTNITAAIHFKKKFNI